MLVTEDHDEPASHRLVAQRKANWSRARPIERHRIEEMLLPRSIDDGRPEDGVTSRMVFVEHAEDVDADDLLGPRSRGDESSKERRAVGFLVTHLAGGDWHPSADVKAAAATEGITERTLQRAQQDLAIKVDRQGFPAVTVWRVPQSRRGFPHTLGATGANGANTHGYADVDADVQSRQPVGDGATVGATENGQATLNLGTASLAEIHAAHERGEL